MKKQVQKEIFHMVDLIVSLFCVINKNGLANFLIDFISLALIIVANQIPANPSHILITNKNKSKQKGSQHSTCASIQPVVYVAVAWNTQTCNQKEIHPFSCWCCLLTTKFLYTKKFDFTVSDWQSSSDR